MDEKECAIVSPYRQHRLLTCQPVDRFRSPAPSRGERSLPTHCDGQVRYASGGNATFAVSQHDGYIKPPRVALQPVLNPDNAARRPTEWTDTQLFALLLRQINKRGISQSVRHSRNACRFDDSLSPFGL
jgi:hypothetical protein